MQSEDCFLRPLAEDDLELVLRWRNSDRVRMAMFDDSIISWINHLAWYKKTQENPDSSKHLIFMNQKIPLGVINVNRFDPIHGRCYWGFYVGEPKAPRGSGMVMGYLGLEYIFGELCIRKLCSEAFAFNEVSVNYHKRLGFLEEGVFLEHILKQGQYHDIVCLSHFRDRWMVTKTQIEKQCFGGDDR
ncbi:UDP-4-amino-4,6-dideoxy-N-acetyl-beta-L-altrosamine N-acetyltransferase [Desulfosporosinus fructosivorans]